MGELISDTAPGGELNFGRDFENLIRFAFGDSAEMANELLDAVLAGEKTGTTWAGAFGKMGAKRSSAAPPTRGRGS